LFSGFVKREEEVLPLESLIGFVESILFGGRLLKAMWSLAGLEVSLFDGHEVEVSDSTRGCYQALGIHIDGSVEEKLAGGGVVWHGRSLSLLLSSSGI